MINSWDYKDFQLTRIYGLQHTLLTHTVWVNLQFLLRISNRIKLLTPLNS